MKKIITDFVKSLGDSTKYSGKTKTIYISDPKDNDIDSQILDKFGYSLPFKIGLY